LFFEEDAALSTFHIGIFDQELLIGAATFIKASTAIEVIQFQYQLRGMAVLSHYQSKGYGRQLISHCTTHLQTLNIKILWCNARTVAERFYTKNGFEIIGAPFDIPKIGKHYCMRKNL